jgi:hypothetical protein
MVDYKTRKVGDVLEYAVDLFKAVLNISVESHIWQEFHHNAPTDIYRGPDDDDRRVVENPDGGTLQPKQRLHLCFLETAITTIDVKITSGTYYAYWQIIDSADVIVNEHPQFTRANYDANDAAARLETAKYGWRWDGRNNEPIPVFVSSPGRYRSRITIKDDTGRQVRQSDSTIEVEGNPYHIFIVGQPKTDDELLAEFARPALRDRLLNRNGQRTTRDSWMTVYRGEENEGHVVFLGQGTIEATKSSQRGCPDCAGAIATPHNSPRNRREYKAWINPRPATARNPNRYDRIHIEDLGHNDGEIELEPNPGGLAPNNPYCNSPPALRPARPIKNGVQAHASGRGEWTSPGMSVGCTCVKRITGATVDSPGSVLGNVRSMNSSFGNWGTTAAENVRSAGKISLDFLNKQTKRDRIEDALIADDHGAPELNPPQHPAGPLYDEPLHMQPTMQGAAFGGFRGQVIRTVRGVQHREIPSAYGHLDDDPVNQLRIRVRLEEYAAGSMYHVYHRAVVFGHVWELIPNGYSFTVWIPRKVIRTWRSNPRNLMIRGNCLIHWYIERRLIGAEGPSEIVERLYHRRDDFASLQARDIGRLQRDWTFADPLASGEYVSVLRYRVRLRPYARADDWQPEAEVTDEFSGPVWQAAIAAERHIAIGRHHYLEGQSELVIETVT